MVQSFFNDNVFENVTWNNMTLASWLKYPNPHTNVLHYDTLSQRMDPKTGILYVTKLVCKKGVLPKWGGWIMKNNPLAYVLEEIEVDPRSKVYRKRTINLSHQKALLVTVNQQIEPYGSLGCKETLSATFNSNFGWGLSKQIEKFALRSYRENSVKSKSAMQYVLEKLQLWNPSPTSSYSLHCSTK